MPDDAFSELLGDSRGAGSAEPREQSPDAGYECASHFEALLGEVWEALSALVENADEVAEALTDGDHPSALADELRAGAQRAQVPLERHFGAGERVQALLVGHERWPRGCHLREGTVFKQGNTARSYLVVLDSGLGGDEVINVPAFCLRRVP